MGTKEDNKRYYERNKEKIKEINKMWRIRNPERVRGIKKRERIRNKEEYKRRSNKWKMKNPEKVKEQKKRGNLKYKMKFPNKVKAQALAQKIPLKPSCEMCDSKNKLTRYHWNYNKPLLVNTLCGFCHKVQHTKNFGGINNV